MWRGGFFKAPQSSVSVRNTIRNCLVIYLRIVFSLSCLLLKKKKTRSDFTAKIYRVKIYKDAARFQHPVSERCDEQQLNR